MEDKINNIKYIYGKLKLNKNLSKQEIKDLKEGQKKMTEMLRMFDRICRENDLKYWAMGGTFIGAIRNNGWVPWDGDIDVSMLVEDKKKFDKIIERELPSNYVYKIAYYSTMENIPKLSKIRDLYSCYYDGNETEGVCLDIFTYETDMNTIKGLKPRRKFPYIFDEQNRVLGHPDKFERKYSDIFPLKEIYFEDVKIYIPNKYKELSKEIWGSYPPKLPHYIKRYPHEGKIDPKNPNKKKPRKYKSIYF